MSFYTYSKAIVYFLLVSVTTLQGQRSPYEEGHDVEFFVMLDGFTKYGGDIKVIDGMTGEEYTKSNTVVSDFHYQMPQILGGFHDMLLAYESKTIAFHLKDGEEHAKQLIDLAASFGIKGFKVDVMKKLNKEVTIYNRLRNKPFFHVDELIVWDRDTLNREGEPDNKYAEHIRFDEEDGEWHRRVKTHWEVDIKRWDYEVHKYQGLDLDTQKGFHESGGLPGNMRTDYFNDVRLSYPIILDSRALPDDQVDYLRRSYIKNLRHLYDPYSWVSKRHERFELGFASLLRQEMSLRSFKVKNRKWFDAVLASFLNDIVSVNRYGHERVYNDIVTRSVFRSYRNQLGVGLDLLNWEESELREPKGNPPSEDANPVWDGVRFNSSWGARLILLDLYLRKGDELVDALRVELKAKKKKEDVVSMFKRVITDVSGMPANRYIELAFVEQRNLMALFVDKIQSEKQKAEAPLERSWLHEN
ncbi:hypothetical protein [Pelagicoccus mobilis]|uniref:Uncharacterized protein n=1 Tax=Pelagicoccus mobilis TaxID=415221 RepID=A0A934VN54_9BACT|nr:hypothetical protein [Pelagicoccus mobilis]MBK1875872.1 hypothetical protein [Pelagicoccus mobilis]